MAFSFYILLEDSSITKSSFRIRESPSSAMDSIISKAFWVRIAERIQETSLVPTIRSKSWIPIILAIGLTTYRKASRKTVKALFFHYQRIRKQSCLSCFFPNFGYQKRRAYQLIEQGGGILCDLQVSSFKQRWYYRSWVQIIHQWSQMNLNIENTPMITDASTIWSGLWHMAMIQSLWNTLWQRRTEFVYQLEGKFVRI